MVGVSSQTLDLPYSIHFRNRLEVNNREKLPSIKLMHHHTQMAVIVFDINMSAAFKHISQDAEKLDARTQKRYINFINYNKKIPKLDKNTGKTVPIHYNHRKSISEYWKDPTLEYYEFLLPRLHLTRKW